MRRSGSSSSWRARSSWARADSASTSAIWRAGRAIGLVPRIAIEPTARRSSRSIRLAGFGLALFDGLLMRLSHRASPRRAASAASAQPFRLLPIGGGVLPGARRASPRPTRAAGGSIASASGSAPATIVSS